MEKIGVTYTYSLRAGGDASVPAATNDASSGTGGIRAVAPPAKAFHRDSEENHTPKHREEHDSSKNL